MAKKLLTTLFALSSIYSGQALANNPLTEDELMKATQAALDAYKQEEPGMTNFGFGFQNNHRRLRRAGINLYGCGWNAHAAGEVSLRAVRCYFTCHFQQ